MDYNTIKHRFENHYILKLLRSRLGALFISFIYREFKKEHISTIEFNQLHIRLCSHIEEVLWEVPENSSIEEYAKKLLENWCSDESRLLRRYYSRDGEMFIELTVDAERSIRWMEELNPKEYVGTESRFNHIFHMLEELSMGLTEDPKIKIEELKKQRREITNQIREIEESGKVERLNAFQIEERFNQLTLTAKELLSDFKEVDNNFRNLVHNFYIKGLEENSRGELLGTTLDGYTELLESPQGKSFLGFWNFLISDMGSDRIGKMVNEIYNNLEDRTEDRFLINLKKYLHHSGENILKTNHKLAAKLNRILSDPKKRENKRLHALIQDIKNEILQSEKCPDIKEREFLYIDGLPEINLNMERPLSLPEVKRIYNIPQSGEAEITNFSKLFSFHALEREEVHKTIKKSLRNKNRVYFSDILKDNRIKHGLEEILTYYDIASSDTKSSIIKEDRIVVSYTINNREKHIELPEIIFCS